MTDLVIYHNPRCSKSRQTLQLLEERGLTPSVVLYLETPPDATTLKGLLKQLGMDSARLLMRTGETEYREMGLSRPDCSEQELIEAMVQCPRLIERPIVVKGEQARVGRPPESVLEII
ncbi:arsenate reductase (glutaredoxin) [Aestuariirhabdus litorea]|uniref:Arsenate reductase n=1 Tax=Aestuariirhabdus litorea TaxID=2528527 RepID=A0A3P3VP79_9GAMM|nr:arsenate reductase (glutaredoxin) [Aestuariirhabdus litorea]RRJ84157.1 arsenate reductase (glutaredoxin) [Aestuariirhabdus litorea]RWW97377.1 arsenate reductase (glutaredoxin) [Endozoicomonadaceae bacterium GTF-13]